jgi:hypothetical protein
MNKLFVAIKFHCYARVLVYSTLETMKAKRAFRVNKGNIDLEWNMRKILN